MRLRRVKIKFTPPYPHFGLALFTRWVLANGVGIGIALSLGWILSGVTLPFLNRIIIWTTIGAIIGAIQYWSLKQHLASSGWFWATTMGWGVGGSIAGYIDIDWAIMGAFVGLAQTFILRNYIYQAGWWILATATALLTAGFIAGSVILLEDLFTFKSNTILITPHINELLGWSISGFVGGLVYGLITGAWLIWLLQTKARSSNSKYGV